MKNEPWRQRKTRFGYTADGFMKELIALTEILSSRNIEQSMVIMFDALIVERLNANHFI